MSRNNERVLSDAMITDIKDQMLKELENPDAQYAFVDTIMDMYLTDDFESFKQIIIENIEHYEDNILLTLNMELTEDSFNQTENDN
jgi:chloramphenicol O-acetyltransferase